MKTELSFVLIAIATVATTAALLGWSYGETVLGVFGGGIVGLLAYSLTHYGYRQEK